MPGRNGGGLTYGFASSVNPVGWIRWWRERQVIEGWANILVSELSLQ